jgi:hypothetical protein
MPDETSPIKQRRKRRIDETSIQHSHRVIAKAIGAHVRTVQNWHYEGRLRYRILMYLLEQNGLEGEAK